MELGSIEITLSHCCRKTASVVRNRYAILTDIRCKRMDWDQVGSLAVINGYYVEHKIVAGPYISKEAASTAAELCE